MNKVFSKEDYLTNDARAKLAVTDFLTASGHKVKEPDNVYGIDLRLTDRSDKLIGFVEVEVRKNNILTYKSIHVPLRKEKLFYHPGFKSYFFALTWNLDFAYYTDSKLITQCKIIEVPNKHMKASEYFYDVPKMHFKFTRLNNRTNHDNDLSQVVNALNNQGH